MHFVVFFLLNVDRWNADSCCLKKHPGISLNDNWPHEVLECTSEEHLLNDSVLILGQHTFCL